MRGFEPMTLSYMRLNGVRMVTASCAQLRTLDRGQRRPAARDPDCPRGWAKRLRCSSCGGSSSIFWLDPLGIQANGRGF